MKKGLGFILGTGSALLAGSISFAATGTTINLVPLPGLPQNVSLQNIPQFVITLLFVVGIVIALAFLIYGGIRWIISGGDKTKVAEARSHIVAAIIGLIIVVTAFIILNFVFQILFGQQFNLAHLCIPTLANPNCQ